MTAFQENSGRAEVQQDLCRRYLLDKFFFVLGKRLQKLVGFLHQCPTSFTLAIVCKPAKL
jgi:hypothetical protein